MRLRCGIVAGALALLMPGTASADVHVLRFEGVARVEVTEILEHGNYDDLGTSIVDLEVEMHGPRYDRWPAYATGTATIGRGDGTTTTIPLSGTMFPPEGGGGLSAASGIGDDSALYCFRIWDQMDAPTPRPDKLLLVVEPGERLARGHADGMIAATGDPASGFPLVPLDNCAPLEGFESIPLSGDFWFSTII